MTTLERLRPTAGLIALITIISVVVVLVMGRPDLAAMLLGFMVIWLSALEPFRELRRGVWRSPLTRLGRFAGSALLLSSPALVAAIEWLLVRRDDRWLIILLAGPAAAATAMIITLLRRSHWLVPATLAALVMAPMVLALGATLGAHLPPYWSPLAQLVTLTVANGLVGGPLVALGVFISFSAVYAWAWNRK